MVQNPYGHFMLVLPGAIQTKHLGNHGWDGNLVLLKMFLCFPEVLVNPSWLQNITWIAPEKKGRQAFRRLVGSLGEDGACFIMGNLKP